MTDIPMIFSAPMVRALLDGRKTVTRRVFSHQWTVLGSRWGKNAPWAGLDIENATVGRLSGMGLPDAHLSVPWVHPEDAARGMRWEDDHCIYRVRPPYDIGDRIWVREAHYRTDDGDYERVVLAADESAVRQHFADLERLPPNFPAKILARHKRLRPSIHMPRWASRLTLVVTDVRVERLQEISEADAKAEGAVCTTCANVVMSSDGFPSYRSGFGILWNSLHGSDAWSANPWVAAISFAVHQCNIDALAEPAARQEQEDAHG